MFLVLCGCSWSHQDSFPLQASQCGLCTPPGHCGGSGDLPASSLPACLSISGTQSTVCLAAGLVFALVTVPSRLPAHCRQPSAALIREYLSWATLLKANDLVGDSRAYSDHVLHGPRPWGLLVQMDLRVCYSFSELRVSPVCHPFKHLSFCNHTSRDVTGPEHQPGSCDPAQWCSRVDGVHRHPGFLDGTTSGCRFCHAAVGGSSCVFFLWLFSCYTGRDGGCGLQGALVVPVSEVLASLQAAGGCQCGPTLCSCMLWEGGTVEMSPRLISPCR